MVTVLFSCEKNKKIHWGCLEVERRSCDAGQRCVMHRVHELHVPGPCMGCVRRCFELAVHVNIVAVFRKVTGAEQQKGSAVAAKYAQ